MFQAEPQKGIPLLGISRFAASRWRLGIQSFIILCILGEPPSVDHWAIPAYVAWGMCRHRHLFFASSNPAPRPLFSLFVGPDYLLCPLWTSVRFEAKVRGED